MCFCVCCLTRLCSAGFTALEGTKGESKPFTFSLVSKPGNEVTETTLQHAEPVHGLTQHLVIAPGDQPSKMQLYWNGVALQTRVSPAALQAR